MKETNVINAQLKELYHDNLSKVIALVLPLRGVTSEAEALVHSMKTLCSLLISTYMANDFNSSIRTLELLYKDTNIVEADYNTGVRTLLLERITYTKEIAKLLA